MRTILTDFRLIDESQDIDGALVVEDSFIKDMIIFDSEARLIRELSRADRVIDGAKLGEQRGNPLVILPSFVELHAHFRDPGFPQKETLESASLAAVRGGYTTLVCMANTRPVIDTFAAARALHERSKAIGLIELYPALSVTKNMEGKELSEFAASSHGNNPFVRVISEDGKDVIDDALFAEAFRAAAGGGFVVSCHCDKDGEGGAVKRALDIANGTGAHVHIAHVSTLEALNHIRAAKNNGAKKCTVTAEAAPHHICLSDLDARELGALGKVAPPLRPETDRDAVFEGLLEGTIDAIATDHAPHTQEDKEAGAPGFSGIETAFSAVYTTIVETRESDLCYLSAIMSANPARILGFNDRGTLGIGKRADFIVADTLKKVKIDKKDFRSRGKNTPFDGFELAGEILMTFFGGKTVYEL